MVTNTKLKADATNVTVEIDLRYLDHLMFDLFKEGVEVGRELSYNREDSCLRSIYQNCMSTHKLDVLVNRGSQ